MKAYGMVNVDATSYQHPEMVQYYCSDWDFALSRADANGLFIYRCTIFTSLIIKRIAL